MPASLPVRQAVAGFRRQLRHASRLSDWPFAMKIGALPLLGLAAGIGIAAYATLTLDYQTRLIRAVVVGDLPVAMRLFEEAGSLQAYAHRRTQRPDRSSHTPSDGNERERRA